jgi:nucleoside-diphosphate-sugar epimerase
VFKTASGTASGASADYILHIGGMVSPKADYLPKTTHRVNVSAAENIAKAVKVVESARAKTTAKAPDSESTTATESATAKAPESATAKTQIKVVYIGSVAQTSDRNPPIHWGRTGDPICISVYDHYAISKTLAEQAIVESGIKNWVSLRQSGILHPGVLNNFDPIMFHVPLEGVLEWATVEDSARLMANLCEKDANKTLPENFWNRFYNIGSGEAYRITNYEFMCHLLKAISCPPPEKIFDANWFALRNFHGQWYADSDALENLLHFRENLPLEAYFERMKGALPGYFRLAKLAPAPIIKAVMRFMSRKKGLGTMNWIKTRNKERISSYFGSYEAWQAIPSWSEHDRSQRPSSTPHNIDHGYDETKPLHQLTLDDMRRAAEFRGGKCLSDSANGKVSATNTTDTNGKNSATNTTTTNGAASKISATTTTTTNGEINATAAASKINATAAASTTDTNGEINATAAASTTKVDMATKLQWQCQFGHCFEASPALILQGGHWCPECLPPSWNYDAIAAGNPFFAQVWHPLHGPDEHNVYPASIYSDWEK